MFRGESDSDNLQIGAADFAAVGIVAGPDISGGAGEKDNAESRLVLAVEIVKSLLFGVIGFVAIDDFVEVAPDASLFHRLMLVAPTAGGHEHVAKAGFFSRF